MGKKVDLADKKGSKVTDHQKKCGFCIERQWLQLNQKWSTRKLVASSQLRQTGPMSGNGEPQLPQLPQPPNVHETFVLVEHSLKFKWPPECQEEESAKNPNGISL